MARPQRNNVDYFPLLCEEGKKMYYLEETYGNDGFAVFIKILRELARTDFHYLDLSKNTTLMFLSAKCKVTKEVLESIITDLVELEKFDRVLWTENKIIWCHDFIDSIQDAYSKRSNKCITYEGLLHLLISLGVRKQSKCKSKDPVNPQSIVEDSKEEETNIVFNFKKSLIDLGIQEQIVTDWLKVRKFKKAANTETAFISIKTQIEKSNLSANACIKKAVENSWAGFKAEWLKNKSTNHPSYLSDETKNYDEF
jgi:hypothetical protein